MDRTEFMRIAGSLSPEEKAAVFGTSSAQARPGAATHKWTHLADALSDADASRVVAACRDGVKYVADHPGEDDAESKAIQAFQAASPALASASANSCRYRQKPEIWGLTRVADYLQSDTAAAKRAAAKRREPQADEPTSKRRREPSENTDEQTTKPDRETRETPAVKASKAT